MEFTLDTIDRAAQYILDHRKTDTLLFNAEMGTGKTTLITTLCKKLGVVEPISSPTYSIVNEYQGRYTTIFHFDLYRLQSIDELHDIGAEEYFDSNSLIFIEWPKLAIPLLDKFDTVDLSIISTEKRMLSLNA